jgi:anti-sigma regulatory factor (Ser/Thr protein kinase)
MDTLIVPGHIDSLEKIAEFVLHVAKSAGLGKKPTFGLRLAIDEIATNVIVHGYQEAGVEGNIRLNASWDENAISVILEDIGAAYDPLKAQVTAGDQLDQPLGNRPIGGLGVYLAVRNVDKFIYERVGKHNRTTFMLYLNKDPKP